MKPVFLSIFILLSIETCSQITIKNISLLKPDTNVLIYGRENILSVSGTSSKVDLVSRLGNTMVAKGNNQFEIITQNLKTDTLSVFAGKNLLLKKAFSINDSFMLKVHVGNLTSDTATVTEILANRGLKVVVHPLYHIPNRIVSFAATFVTSPSDTLAKNIRTEGPFFSAEQEYYIKKLRKNSKLILDVRIMFPDSKLREYGPYFIFIK